MFVFGEAKGKVIDGKLVLPKEYNLNNKTLFGKWSDDYTVLISDNIQSLNYADGKGNRLFDVSLNTNSSNP